MCDFVGKLHYAQWHVHLAVGRILGSYHDGRVVQAVHHALAQHRTVALHAAHLHNVILTDAVLAKRRTSGRGHQSEQGTAQ